MNTGIIFLQQDSFIISGDRFTLVTDVSTITFYMACSHLEQAIQGIRNETQGIKNHTIFQQVMAMTKDQQTIIQEIRDELADIDFQNPGSKRRRSTAPFFFVGEAFSFLFGSSTQDDIDSINQKLGNVSHFEENLRLNIKDQIVVMQHLNEFQNKNVRLMHAVTEAENSISAKILEIKSKEISFEHTVQIIAFILSKLNVISFHININHMSVNQYQNAMAYAANGRLTSYIISKQKLFNALLNIERSLTGKYKMIFPVTKHNIAKYFALIKVHAAYNAKTTRIYMDLPLKSNLQTFKMYHLRPFPANIINTTVSLAFKPPIEYVAIDSDRQSFLFLNSNSLDKCSRTNIITICPPDVVLHDFKYGSCLYALYHNDTDDVLQLCERVLIPFDRPPIFYSTFQSDIWVYSIGEPIIVMMICPEVEGKRYELQGTGKIRIPHECELQAGEFKIASSNSWTNGVASSLPANFFFPNFNSLLFKNESDLFKLSASDIELNNHINNIVRASYSLESSSIDGINLRTLKQKLNEMRPPIIDIHKNIWSIVFTFTVVGTTVGIIIYYFVYIKFCGEPVEIIHRQSDVETTARPMAARYERVSNNLHIS